MNAGSADSADAQKASRDPIREAVEAAIRRLYRPVDVLSADEAFPISLPNLPYHAMTAEADRRDVKGFLQRLDLALKKRDVSNTHEDGADWSWTDTNGPQARKEYLLKCWCEAYSELCERLSLEFDQVEPYFRLEHRLLASMHFAAREATPSRDRLKRLAIQLAMDVRLPIKESLQRFERGRRFDADLSLHYWRIRVQASVARTSDSRPLPLGLARK